MPVVKAVDIIIKYWAINMEGKKIKGKCERYKFAQLKASLREEEYYIYNQSSVKNYRNVFLKKSSMMDISVLCSQMSIMLGAGIPVSKTLDDLEKQCGNNSVKQTLKAVKEEVVKGKELHESMAQFKYVFPVFMVEMVKIGEESGRLDEIFKKLSEYYEKCYSIISSLKTSLIYPAITLVVSIFVLLFLMVDIVPQFIDIIISNGSEVPVLTKIVMYSCQFLRLHYIQILASVIFIGIISYGFRKNCRVADIVENIKIRIPYFNKIYSDLMIFKICSSMAILVKSGVNIITALKITSELAGHGIMSNKMEKAIKYVEGGESICEAMSKAKINDKLFLSLINTAENTGNIDVMFLKLEQLFGNKLDRCLKKMVRIVEPIIIIFLSLLVGIFVISALMPIFTIMESTL
ncbi:type II secretion system F family protein [Clostridium sp. MT-14]|uniref:type II secretion system F family protein n=1 Tax=Clostridium sp. MT-14 TaxID=3348360 RepID=UPI00156CB307|nr:Type II secretion system protein F [Clostridiaceae bacterium BL-3]